MQFFHHHDHSGAIGAGDSSKPHMHSTRQPSAMDDSPLRVHIGNIPFSWSDKHLREQFDIFGPVDDVEVVSNAQGSKGFGFLTFLRRRDGERAMQVKSGTIADGRKITVSLAVAKNQSAPSVSSTPPQTPGRTTAAIPTALAIPSLLSSSSLSPNAPMWMPLTPPSSSAWRTSPESQSNEWMSHSPPRSSSPLSILFPPLLSPPRIERTMEQRISNHHWRSSTIEPIPHEKTCYKHCPHCGRSVYW